MCEFEACNECDDVVMCDDVTMHKRIGSKDIIYSHIDMG